MAIIANLFVDQGSDFSVNVDCTDAVGAVMDLTGYTAAAQIRKTYGSSSATSTFTCSHNSAGGAVTMALTDTQTTAIESGRYVYDLNITSGAGVVSRVVEGQLTVTPGVTR